MRTRSSMLGLTGLLVGVLVSIAYMIVSPSSSSHKMNAEQLLVGQLPVEQIRLYPADEKLAIVSAADYLNADLIKGRPFTRQKEADGGFIDTYYRADRTRQFSLAYFAASPGFPNQLAVATIFSGDGLQTLQESQFRVDGMRQMRGRRLPNGDYETVTYFGDGLTRASLKVVGQGPIKWDHDPQLLSETHWYQDGKVAYTNVLHDDMSRTVIALDESGAQVETMQLPEYCNGATFVAYYPGTRQVRLQGTSTVYETTALYYRTDGTLRLTEVLSSTTLELIRWDATGKLKVLDQTWYFTRVTDNGVAKITNLALNEVLEFDQDGKQTQQWSWFGSGESGRIWSYQTFNTVTAGPNPIPLKSRVNFYRQEDGTLQRTDFHPADSAIKDWFVEHAAAENLQPPPVPARDREFTTIDLDLPIPFPQMGGM